MRFEEFEESETVEAKVLLSVESSKFAGAVTVTFPWRNEALTVKVWDAEGELSVVKKPAKAVGDTARTGVFRISPERGRVLVVRFGVSKVRLPLPGPIVTPLECRTKTTWDTEPEP